ncbi:hypothetical protein MMC17_000432 [Xylographa soralifera]|nr:hypothetical protein [Xylographa soralifera]
MGVVRLEERASAAQILVDESEAEELTPPRGKIPPPMPLAVPVRIPSPEKLTSVPIPKEHEGTTEFKYEIANDFRFDDRVRQAFTAAIAKARRRPGLKEKSLDGGIRKRELRKRAVVVKRGVASLPRR